MVGNRKRRNLRAGIPEDTPVTKKRGINMRPQAPAEPEPEVEVTFVKEKDVNTLGYPRIPGWRIGSAAISFPTDPEVAGAFFGLDPGSPEGDRTVSSTLQTIAATFDDDRIQAIIAALRDTPIQRVAAQLDTQSPVVAEGMRMARARFQDAIQDWFDSNTRAIRNLSVSLDAPAFLHVDTVSGMRRAVPNQNATTTLGFEVQVSMRNPRTTYSHAAIALVAQAMHGHMVSMCDTIFTRDQVAIPGFIDLMIFDEAYFFIEANTGIHIGQRERGGAIYIFDGAGGCVGRYPKTRPQPATRRDCIQALLGLGGFQ